jgi:hypothetical protein
MFIHAFAGTHNGPTASKRIMTLNRALEGVPDAIDPALSKTNLIFP